MSSDKVLYVNPETKDVIATGNVGIGTTQPLAKLHVSGNVVTTGNLGIGTTQPMAKLHVDGSIVQKLYHVSGTRTNDHLPSGSSVEVNVPYSAIIDPYLRWNNTYYDVPVNGHYFVNFNCMFFNCVNDMFIRVMRFNSTGLTLLSESHAFYQRGYNSYQSLGITCIMNALQGDRLYMRAFYSNGGTIWLHASHGNLSIYLLNPT
jgi:hypothetical protein